MPSLCEPNRTDSHLPAQVLVLATVLAVGHLLSRLRVTWIGEAGVALALGAAVSVLTLLAPGLRTLVAFNQGAHATPAVQLRPLPTAARSCAAPMPAAPPQPPTQRDCRVPSCRVLLPGVATTHHLPGGLLGASAARTDS